MIDPSKRIKLIAELRNPDLTLEERLRILGKLKGIEEVKNPESGYTPIKGVDYRDGLIGRTGERGPVGLAGSVGPKGDTGDKGDMGPHGPRGLQGIPGVPGMDGRDGKNGINGETPEVAQIIQDVIKEIEKKPIGLSNIESGKDIEGLIKFLKSGGFRGGGGLSRVVTDATLTGDGTPSSPLHVVSGSGSPLTTKGDLYTFSTINTRLPVGTNGQLLSADSTATTGLKWVDGLSGYVPYIGATANLQMGAFSVLAQSFQSDSYYNGSGILTLDAGNCILTDNVGNPKIVWDPDISFPSLTTNGFVKTILSSGTLVIDTNTYLTGNQTITLSGEASGSGATAITVTLSNAAIIAKVLTGYVSGAGTVSATDSILQAIQKLNGNIVALPAYTFSTGLTNTANTITVNLSTGVSGGQSVIGGTNASNSLTLSSTTSATKGRIISDSQVGWTTGLGSITHVLGPSDQTLTIRGVNFSGAAGTSILIKGGDTTAFSSGSVFGDVTIAGGDNNTNAGGARAGDVYLLGGIGSASGGGGNVTITSRGGAGTGGFFPVGFVLIQSGGMVNASTGPITIQSGTPTGAGNQASGAITIRTGNALNTSTPNVLSLIGGNGGATGAGGSIAITSGNGGTLTSGNVTVTIGQANAAAAAAFIVQGTTATAGSGLANTGSVVTIGTGTGQTNTSNSGGGLAGNGGAWALNLGAGGAAQGVGTSTGGNAGDFAQTGGVGGASAGITVGTGGRGSDFSWITGTGGAATGASGTRNGGRGGNMLWQTSIGGTGGTANGAVGTMTWNIGGAVTKMFLDATQYTLQVDLKLQTVGNGIYIKEGANATMGTATLVGGTVVVNTTKVTANSRIFLQTDGGTLLNVGAPYVSARTATTSFTITSTNVLDTSNVDWIIVEPA